MVNLTTTLAAAGTAVLIGDYLDRRLGVSHDVNLVRKLLRLKTECVAPQGAESERTRERASESARGIAARSQRTPRDRDRTGGV